MSLFPVRSAITHKAEQIFYSQNYWVADTNEEGLGTWSKLITVLAPALRAGATLYYTLRCCYTSSPLSCNTDTGVCLCVGYSGFIELENIAYYKKSVWAGAGLKHLLRDPG